MEFGRWVQRIHCNVVERKMAGVIPPIPCWCHEHLVTLLLVILIRIFQAGVQSTAKSPGGQGDLNTHSLAPDHASTGMEVAGVKVTLP